MVLAGGYMNRKRISAFFTIVMVLAVILSLSACGEDKPCLHKDVNQDGRCDNCDLVIAVYLDLSCVASLVGNGSAFYDARYL